MRRETSSSPRSQFNTSVSQKPCESQRDAGLLRDAQAAHTGHCCARSASLCISPHCESAVHCLCVLLRYFVVTPKLLPQLEYSSRVRIFQIYNGLRTRRDSRGEATIQPCCGVAHCARWCFPSLLFCLSAVCVCAQVLRC